MSVRLKLALTIFATGLVTALAVLATVVFAFQRFEHESTYQRASAFLVRVVATYDNLFELHERHPEDFGILLRNLVLFEPDTQLYLLDNDGRVLASTGTVVLPADFRVEMGPVRQAASSAPGAAYVMGDDPERMDADAVVAARPVGRQVIRAGEPIAGYLYLVCHKEGLPASRWQALRSAFARPALGLIAAIMAFTTLLAVLVIASVTRPLQRLTAAVAALSRDGLQEGAAQAHPLLPAPTTDEFGQLTRAFDAMLTTLRTQWEALRRLDHFRREAVSNLSHDLRSPLTATTACLETLQSRWSGDITRADDLRMAEVALRNTRNAARMVQSLGDLATLDEPAFQLRPEVVDLGELVADVAARFAERGQQRGVMVEARPHEQPVAASVDVELFERALANLVDNALKFCDRGSRITIGARGVADDEVEVSVSDTGPGIPEAELPHLFDRFYQARQTVAPATGEGGKGLGLAIVKRIAELHGGSVSVISVLEQGTEVVLRLPATPPERPSLAQENP